MLNFLDIPSSSIVDFSKTLDKVFWKQEWIDVFLVDRHHGIGHANTVRGNGLNIFQDLTKLEKQTLNTEISQLTTSDQDHFAIKIIEIASWFHDCWRFNDNGLVIKNEQNSHHILSNERMISFCKNLWIKDDVIELISDAILCHDFRNTDYTPELSQPQYITSKIVQSADQLGRFHISAVHRSIEFNKSLGLPFFDKTITAKQRIDWKPNLDNYDAVTAIVNWLFSPTSESRFWLKYSQDKVLEMKKLLKKEILLAAKQYECTKEVKEIIAYFKAQ